MSLINGFVDGWKFFYVFFVQFLYKGDQVFEKVFRNFRQFCVDDFLFLFNVWEIDEQMEILLFKCIIDFLLVVRGQDYYGWN